MSQNLTISDTGLKLIKAFEGFRPVDRELITGQRVVGYGHRLYSDDAVMMDKGEAEAILRSDLEPFCLLYTSPSPRDKRQSRMPSSA